MATKVFTGKNAFALVVGDIKKCQKIAAVNAVNRVAYTARKNAITNVEKNFTLRNNFTTRNIFTTPAKKSASLNDIAAYTGALEQIGYMERQETGGTKRSPSGSNLIIPNTRARGGSNSKKVQSRFRYSHVAANTVHWSSKSGSRKARLVATAFVAAKNKKFIRLNNSFFQVTNFRKGKKAVSFKTKQILNLKHKTTYTPANPWLEPASEYAANLMQDFYNQEMDKL